MSQIPSIREDLVTTVNVLNDVKNAIEYCSSESYNGTATDYGNSIREFKDYIDTGKNAENIISGLEEQISNLENTKSEYENDFVDIENAIVEKGGTVTGSYNNLGNDIREIPTGSSTPVLQNITIRATQSAQYISADDGYDGLGTVTIEGVDNTIDSDIKAENIKNGVNILGITGTYSGSGSTPNYQQKTVTPSASEQVISADSEYDALSQVIVNGSSNLLPENIKKDIEIFGVTGTAEVGGIILNAHPTILAYAGQQGSTSQDDILPADCSWTKYVDLENINVSQGLKNVFYNNTVVTDIDLTGWNFETKAISTVQYMFYGCTNLQYIRGTLKLNKCTGYGNTFSNCNSLINCPITNFGFDTTTTTIILDLSASNVLDAASMITNMDTNESGKTRILKLHADVLAGLSDEIKALAASKNITLQ